MLTYRHHSCDDIEDLYSQIGGEGWEFEHLQLTAGELGFSLVSVDLPDIAIHWYQYAAAIHALECHRNDAVFLTFALSAGGTPNWFGRPCDKNHALLFHPDSEQDYVLPGNVRSLGLLINRRLLRSMGWDLKEAPLMAVDPRAMAPVIVRCKEATRAARRGAVTDQQHAMVLQERIALALSELLQPWLSANGSERKGGITTTRTHHVVSSARNAIAEWGSHERLSINSLAERVRVSPRTLYRSFQDNFGMGPYEYHVLMKLRAFRKALRQSRPRFGLITSLAYSEGFQHMGHFSSTYRAHYDESPSETLRRWQKNGHS